MIEHKWSETVVAFLVGLGLGAALGVLLAPGSGEDTRDFIRGSVEGAVDAVAAEGRKLSRQMQHTIENAGEHVRDAATAGAKAFQDAKKASA
jgi:gas vesicle protein